MKWAITVAASAAVAGLAAVFYKVFAGGAEHSEESPAGNFNKELTRALEMIRRDYGAQRLSTDEPFLTTFLRLDRLAQCNPADGVDALLDLSIGQQYLVPVAAQGHVDYGVELSDRDGSWQLAIIWPHSRFMAEICHLRDKARARERGSNFSVVRVPALSRVLIRYSSMSGNKLVCLSIWPSDPPALITEDDEVKILHLLKAIARQSLSSNPPSDESSGG